MSSQTTIIERHVDTSATIIYMGEDCLLEGLTLHLNCSGNNDNVVLRGIVFDGTSSQTSKIRTTYIYVNNKTMTLSSNVFGIEFLGITDLNGFSRNSVKNSMIHIFKWKWIKTRDIGIRYKSCLHKGL